MNDTLKYVGGASAGVLLARSFGAKALGIMMGGVGGLALAAYLLLQPKKIG